VDLLSKYKIRIGVKSYCKNIQTHCRKFIRLKNYDYTHCRECVLGEMIQGEMRLNIVGEIVEKYRREILKHFPNVELDEHVNRVLLFAELHSQASSYPIIFIE